MKTVLNFFSRIFLISIVNDVFPVPPKNILPIQIVLILKIFLVCNFFIKLNKKVIIEKG